MARRKDDKRERGLRILKGVVLIPLALALLKHSELDATEIVRESLGIASDLCIYTNRHITVEQVANK